MNFCGEILPDYSVITNVCETCKKTLPCVKAIPQLLKNYSVSWWGGRWGERGLTGGCKVEGGGRGEDLLGLGEGGAIWDG